ncbi:MAG: hypothetical protein Q9202_005415 [Teloschistes flavicans]
MDRRSAPAPVSRTSDSRSQHSTASSHTRDTSFPPIIKTTSSKLTMVERLGINELSRNRRIQDDRISECILQVRVEQNLLCLMNEDTSGIIPFPLSPYTAVDIREVLWEGLAVTTNPDHQAALERYMGLCEHVLIDMVLKPKEEEDQERSERIYYRFLSLRRSSNSEVKNAAQNLYKSYMKHVLGIDDDDGEGDDWAQCRVEER